MKILFLSGQDDPFPGVSGNKSDVSKELGVEDFVMKTESLDVLVAKVKTALGMAKQGLSKENGILKPWGRFRLEN